MIPKKIQNSIWFNGLLALVAIVLSLAVYRAVKQAVGFKNEEGAAQKKLEVLQQKKQELEARILELQTVEAKERAAKERLNLKKTGEEVVVVLPEKPKEQITTPKSNLWTKLKRFFKSQ